MQCKRKICIICSYIVDYYIYKYIHMKRDRMLLFCFVLMFVFCFELRWKCTWNLAFKSFSWRHKIYSSDEDKYWTEISLLFINDTKIEWMKFLNKKILPIFSLTLCKDQGNNFSFVILIKWQWVIALRF